MVILPAHTRHGCIRSRLPDCPEAEVGLPQSKEADRTAVEDILADKQFPQCFPVGMHGSGGWRSVVEPGMDWMWLECGRVG